MNTVIKWGMVLALAGTMAAQAAPKKKHKVAAKPAEPAVTQSDVQSLKDTLTAQQQAIEALKGELAKRDQNWQDAQQKLTAAQAAAEEAQKRATAVEAGAQQDRAAYNELSSKIADSQTALTNSTLSLMDDQKRMSALETALGRFKFTGDIRVRGENFNQEAAQDRNRARVRARFGFEGKLGDFTGGLAIATGSFGDPTSTNETLTNYFDRKTIGLDKAYVIYNPSQFKALQLTGGKFSYPWIRTSVTFDPDINPEGFSEKLSFDLHHTGVIKNVTAGIYQLVYNESSGGQDSYALGAHGSAKLQPFPWWTATASFSATKWNRPDAILQASAFATSAAASSKVIQVVIPATVSDPTPAPPSPTTVTITLPGEGPGCGTPKGLLVPPIGTATTAPGLISTPPCIFAPNGMTNAITVSSTSTAGIGVPHFASGFLYADFILNNQFKTPIKRLPLNVVAEYENNLDALSHPLGPQDPTTGISPVRTDLGSQSHAYYFEVNAGQTSHKGDFQVGYAWLRQEQDSVLAAFVESDQRAPTNILQHRFFVLYKLNPNTTAGFTFWRGRTLNTSLQNAVLGPGVAVGTPDHFLNRLQFDIIYSF